MFKFFWLRRLIRNTTSPIPVNKAELWQKRLKLIYSILAWNAFGFVVIACFQGKLDWAQYYEITENETQRQESPGEKWLKFFNPKSAEVYRVSGLNITKVAEYKDGKRTGIHMTEDN